MMIIALLSILLLVSMTIVFLLLKKKGEAIGDKTGYELAQAQAKVQALVEERERLTQYYQQEKQDLLQLLDVEREKVLQSNTRLEGAIVRYKADQEKIDALKNFHETAKLEFENLSSKLLEEKSQKFTEQNTLNLDRVLTPLRERIKEFEEKVDKTYRAEAAERNVLKGTIHQLMEQSKQMSEQALSLTKALKGDNKQQGNWGEQVLSKLLEASGLIKGLNYETQSKLNNEDGDKFLPDVLVFLPDNKHIVIDSKVSLLAYERLINCEIEEEKPLYLRQHLDSIKGHIKGLSDKNYQGLRKDGIAINAPDFVLLFMPIESSFAIAVQHDQDLFNFAWERKVVIVTPSTLLATLKTIASIWKQEQQTKNAQEIAKKAGDLYDKFVGFVEDVEKIGKQLEATQNTYNDAMNKLSTGRGNLINRASELQKLGAKNQKQLPQNLIDTDND